MNGRGWGIQRSADRAGANTSARLDLAELADRVLALRDREQAQIDRLRDALG